MALSQTDLDRLDAAITSAELEVQFADGRRVRYKTTADLIAARSHAASVMAGQASAAGQGSGSVFRFRFTTQRGGI